MRMDRVKVLLVDLCGEWELVVQLQAILETAPKVSWELKRETITLQTIGIAAKRLAAVRSGFEPDLNLLSVAPNRLDAALQMLEVLRNSSSGISTLLLLTADCDEIVPALLAQGASDYVVAPWRAIDLLPRISRMVRACPPQESSAEALKRELGLGRFVGQSPALLTELKNIAAAARCPANVLITGETGTGKELVARAIHDLSSRASK